MSISEALNKVIQTTPLSLKGLLSYNHNAKVKCAICGIRSINGPFAYLGLGISLAFFKLKDRQSSIFINKKDHRDLCYCANCADGIEFLDAKYYTCQLSKEDITIF